MDGINSVFMEVVFGVDIPRCREILEGRRQKSSTEEEWRSEGNKGHGA